MAVQIAGRRQQEAFGQNVIPSFGLDTLLDPIDHAAFYRQSDIAGNAFRQQSQIGKNGQHLRIP